METQPFISAIEQICEEKGISKEKVIEAIEMALAAAYKKDYGKKGQNIKVKIDIKTGKMKFYQVKLVVDESMLREETEEETETEDSSSTLSAKDLKTAETTSEEKEEDTERKIRFNPEKHIMVDDAKKIKKGIKSGDELESLLETHKDYGRIAAQTAKQVVIQRIREAEREAVYDEYKEKEKEIVSGIVQRIENGNVFLDIGKATGILFPEEQIPRENYRIGQRLRVYIIEVQKDMRGSSIILSRAHSNMINQLFTLEVPEISAGTVVIKSIAREAGSRSKIAVASTEERIDPIGSMIGQRGTRVQAVINELSGEKIDIVEWSDDPVKFISNALSPAKVIEVEIDKKEQKAKVIVPDDQLSLAIGIKGQNARLAAKLTGWKIDINIQTKESIEEKPKIKKKTKKSEKTKEKKVKKIKKTKLTKI
ncbi:transcription termination factor NusA [Patescibacteria group bacterium]